MNATLHFLGYNTHLFLKTAPGLVPNQIYYDNERLNGIITEVKKLSPDIVGLSEVWANSSKEQFIKGLKELFPYSAWDQNKNPLQIGSGLLLLSRFPLLNIQFTPYNQLVGFDRLSQKGFILATIEVEGQKVLIAHTHTQADNDGTAIEARKSNLLQLQSGISNSADFSTPAILLGDLNIIGEDSSGSPTEEYQFLLDTLKLLQMTDSYRTVHPSATSELGYTYDAVNNKLIAIFAPNDTTKKLRQRIDYMFVRRILPKSVTVPNSYFAFLPPDGKGVTDLSDHYPLYGSFLLP
ncbi:MAG: endonuclease/exonuclease/phosphatase family protein [Microcystis aeruginosa PMC 728.11]|nr:endonuclease/exonuclease/phosphatase family protein [Microcystis aeruginosa PMC 728.11]